jgi:hypothetical protein
LTVSDTHGQTAAANATLEINPAPAGGGSGTGTGTTTGTASSRGGGGGRLDFVSLVGLVVLLMLTVSRSARPASLQR